jgi:hypothetical protein
LAALSRAHSPAKARSSHASAMTGTVVNLSGGAIVE